MKILQKALLQNYFAEFDFVFKNKLKIRLELRVYVMDSILIHFRCIISYPSGLSFRKQAT